MVEKPCSHGEHHRFSAGEIRQRFYTNLYQTGLVFEDESAISMTRPTTSNRALFCPAEAAFPFREQHSTQIITDQDGVGMGWDQRRRRRIRQYMMMVLNRYLIVHIKLRPAIRCDERTGDGGVRPSDAARREPPDQSISIVARRQKHRRCLIDLIFLFLKVSSFNQIMSGVCNKRTQQQNSQKFSNKTPALFTIFTALKETRYIAHSI